MNQTVSCRRFAYLSDKLQGDLISYDRGVSYGDVGKRTGVNHDRCPLNGL
jgi:hypothetical protein